MKDIKTQIGDVKVEFKDEMKDMGEWFRDTLLVQINRRQNLYNQKQVLLHELIHSFEDATGNKFKEAEIDALAYYILYLIRHNEEMLKWLKE